MMAQFPEHRRLVEPVITPRFVPTCSDEVLTGLGAMSEVRSLRIQSHLAEAHDQVEWVKRERGIDDIEVFDRVSNSQIKRFNAQQELVRSINFSLPELFKHTAHSSILLLSRSYVTAVQRWHIVLSPTPISPPNPFPFARPSIDR